MVQAHTLVALLALHALNQWFMSAANGATFPDWIIAVIPVGLCFYTLNMLKVHRYHFHPHSVTEPMQHVCLARQTLPLPITW